MMEHQSESNSGVLRCHNDAGYGNRINEEDKVTMKRE